MKNLNTGDHLYWLQDSCHILCVKKNIRLADALLLSFCSRFECIYGTQAVKPNMHMQGHLTECVKDYAHSHHFGASLLRGSMVCLVTYPPIIV